MTNETTASERERLPPAPDLGIPHCALHEALRDLQASATWKRPPSQALVDRIVAAARAALPAPAYQVLVPKRLTRAMREVLDEEGWTWEDLLAAAEAITEAEYAELQAAPADQPPSQEARDPWQDLFWQLALELDCLPSTFLDGNAHVFRRAVEMKAAACTYPRCNCPFDAPADRKARQQEALTDEQCDAIYEELDAWARDVDNYDYGLPMFGKDKGRELIRAAIAKGERHER